MRFNSAQIQKIGKEIRSKVDGKTLFDEFSRGRYSTDASVYQIKPLGVVLPKDTNDVLSLMEYSQKNSVPLLARGGGSSQCGQTVGESVVLDYSKHQNKILELNVEEKYVWVQPGVVLDHLNDYLKPHGLWFPVDVSTSSRATIGGMSANNSCGSRSLYYGNMVHNVLAIEAILDDGSIFQFDQINKNYLATKNNQDRLYKIIDKFIDVKKSIMIGDSETDAESAKAAKIPFILLEDGYTDKKVSDIHHDYLIKNFDGIEEIIKKYLID
ncbi:FAD-binding protein [Candidatus Pelagibacter sp.]|nr:FAD-binding protein [Candidatus Pelagibacter sp.]